jgi:uncharacterized protein (TIGR02466 family)
MNYKVESWFPRPIYYADDICQEHLGDFEIAVKDAIKDEGTKRNPFLGVNSSHKTVSELHKLPALAPLASSILDHAMNFCLIIGYDPETAFSFNIINMWVNISDQHDYNFPHTHPGSVISGAFYIKATPENIITFYDKYETLTLPLGQDTMYSMSHTSYDCLPGRLLLFKSDFVHGNVPQKLPGEKIVISFNIG